MIMNNDEEEIIKALQHEWNREKQRMQQMQLSNDEELLRRIRIRTPHPYLRQRSVRRKALIILLSILLVCVVGMIGLWHRSVVGVAIMALVGIVAFMFMCEVLNELYLMHRGGLKANPKVVAQCIAQLDANAQRRKDFWHYWIACDPIAKRYRLRWNRVMVAAMSVAIVGGVVLLLYPTREPEILIAKNQPMTQQINPNIQRSMEPTPVVAPIATEEARALMSEVAMDIPLDDQNEVIVLADNEEFLSPELDIVMSGYQTEMKVRCSSGCESEVVVTSCDDLLDRII